jgi:alkanesulfonate monooxygenase SsuD/methylene tetrahydromethanopterin reductase-like flavin-dependent oxidoreductase (luciferase family)
MEFDILSLGDHLPMPGSDRHCDTQADRHTLWVEMGRIGEALGFRGIQFGERHDSEYIISSPQMILAAIAGVTKRIKRGPGVSLLANIDPVRVAADFATLDQLSKGRAEIGFGSGIEEKVFRLFGQDAGGPERMTCMFDLGGLPAEDVMQSMELFAKSVMPLVNEALRPVRQRETVAI